MFDTIITKVREGWKAVVALLIPIAFAAAVDMIDVVAVWVQDAGGVWSGVAVGVLTSLGVWLKSNQPQ